VDLADKVARQIVSLANRAVELPLLTDEEIADAERNIDCKDCGKMGEVCHYCSQRIAAKAQRDADLRAIGTGRFYGNFRRIL
jgi:DNA-directed RNA polymerase subunit RPC12/RpoP